jgi:hypothetical protein
MAVTSGEVLSRQCWLGLLSIQFAFRKYSARVSTGTPSKILGYFLQSLQAYLIDSIEENPSWEPNSHLASQEISLASGNPRVHYRIHKSLPLDFYP